MRSINLPSIQTGVPVALALLAIATWSRLAICPVSAATELTSSDLGGQKQSKLQGLLEWRRYFQHLAKKYSSPLEAARRQVYLLANAIRVYTTGVAYRKRKSSHYLALNHLSDRSPEELEGLLNAVMAGGRPQTARRNTAQVDADLQDEDPAGLAETLEAGIGFMPDNLEDVLDATTGDEVKPRQKRNVEAKADREITLDMLIQDTEPVPEPPEVLAKMQSAPESNNPNYKQPTEAAVVAKRGLVEQQEKLNAWLFSVQPGEIIDKAADARPKSLLDQVGEFFGGFGRSLLANKRDTSEGLPDAMFHDLRRTGCLFQPRDQGEECGACYAFAGVAMAEFLFCKQMGKLYAFSEQYLIDCGRGRVGRMEGCSGALAKDLPTFVHNYGLELRDRYPYAGSELQCPYSNETDLKTTGYIRMELRDYVFVPVRAWPRVLEASPIFVALAAPAHFLQYGGGVDSGQKCAQKSNHAVLVVGHGREDGQEFWLMRNSHGVHWGQMGYYKLAKSAPERCIEKQMGLVWGTKDALDFGVRTVLNELNLQVKRDPVPDLNKLFA